MLAPFFAIRKRAFSRVTLSSRFFHVSWLSSCSFISDLQSFTWPSSIEIRKSSLFKEVNQQTIVNKYTNFMCTRIKFTKSPTFCMTTFSASLKKLTPRLPQSRDCSCHVGRPILAPPLLWLKKHWSTRTRLRALWHKPSLADVAFAWSWRFCGINPSISLLD